MALVNLDTTVKRVCELLQKLEPPQGVEKKTQSERPKYM